MGDFVSRYNTTANLKSRQTYIGLSLEKSRDERYDNVAQVSRVTVVPTRYDTLS